MLVHTRSRPAEGDRPLVPARPLGRHPWPRHEQDQLGVRRRAERRRPAADGQDVSQLTGLQIDHYLYVDLNGFQEVVNTLGGVDLCIPSYNVNTPGWVEGSTRTGTPSQIHYDEVGHIVDPNTGLDVVPGCQKLDGSQGARLRARTAPALRARSPTSPGSGGSSSSCARVINQMLQAGADREGAGSGRAGARRASTEIRVPAAAISSIWSGRCAASAPALCEFRAVPGTDAMVERPRCRQDGPERTSRSSRRSGTASRSITGVGTQLVNTPPSEANTTVAVIDAGGGDAAQRGRGHADRTRGSTSRPASCQGVAPKGVKKRRDPVSPRRRRVRRRREQVLPGAAGGRGQEPRRVRGDPRADRLPRRRRPAIGRLVAAADRSECPNPTA